MRNAAFLLSLSCGVALAQPKISAGGVVNAASYAPAFQKNSGIAQGSTFVIFGSGLGPATLQLVSSYPLPTTQGLGGTTVTANVAGSTVPCILIYTSATQVSAVLQSRTPLGRGTITVTYNGATSNAADILVAPATFGAFSLASSGAGPGVIQNFVSANSTPTNTFTSPARPGQYAILWGTGLGAVAGNEAAQPAAASNLAADMDLEVLVGSQFAPVVYGGRSTCCTGVDEIVFQVPAGVEGCFVPVGVMTNGVVSNLTTMAIASTGNTCSDPFGMSGADLQKGLTAGALRSGSINLATATTTLSGNGQVQTQRSDTGSGAFYQTTVNQLIRGNIVGTPSLGSCINATVLGGNGPQAASATALLDSGPTLNISGPSGAAQMTSPAKGSYAGQFGNSFLQPGTYTVDNGQGGADVGAFQARITVPPTLTWTNARAIDTVSALEPLEIDWSGGDPSGAVVITGVSLDLATGNGGVFICLERGGANRFTIPQYVLSNIPATSLPVGLLLVAGTGPQVKFSASGLDAGYLSYTVGVGKNVTFVSPTPKQ